MLLVTGATGLNGSALLRRLSAMHIPVRALVRSRDRAAAIAALPHVEIVVGDMAVPASLAGPLAGVERVMLISPSAPNMLEVQTNVIEAARSAGVRHVVKLSGIIPDIASAFRYARMHGEIEQRLEASGMAFTQLRAGEFMPSYFRQVPNIVGKGLLMLPMADARIASIDIGDVAEVAALALTEPGHEGRTYPLTGPAALSMAEVAVELSAVTGKPIRYVNVDPEQMRQDQLAALHRRCIVRALRRAAERQGSDRLAAGLRAARPSGDELCELCRPQRGDLSRRGAGAENLGAKL